jgi:hypothetical protein
MYVEHDNINKELKKLNYDDFCIKDILNHLFLYRLYKDEKVCITIHLSKYGYILDKK